MPFSTELTDQRVISVQIADAGLRQIAALYRIKAGLRGHYPEDQLAARQKRASPKITEFEHWLIKHRVRFCARATLGEALKYIAKSGTA